MKDGYYIIESHSGDRHFCYIEGGLVYFCGELNAEPAQLLIEDNWKLLHDTPIDLSGYIAVEDGPVVTDPIVGKVVDDLMERSAVGITKYGTTLADNNSDDFLQHLKEELMDAVLYITKLQSTEQVIEPNEGAL